MTLTDDDDDDGDVDAWFFSLYTTKVGVGIPPMMMTATVRHQLEYVFCAFRQLLVRSARTRSLQDPSHVQLISFFDVSVTIGPGQRAVRGSAYPRKCLIGQHLRSRHRNQRAALRGGHAVASRRWYSGLPLRQCAGSFFLPIPQ
jgi:hypothetical protein